MDNTYYFITVMENLESGEGWLCLTGDSRCWGFFTDKQDAVDVLHKNATDLRETCYNYAVLEEYTQGICGYNFVRQFFKWDGNRQGFYEIEEPECVKNICSFAIG